MVTTLFDHIKQASVDFNISVKVSLVEIYDEKIKDLIDPTKGFLNLKDVSEKFVHTKEEVLTLKQAGDKHRATAFTKMNAKSSRSHSIFILSIIHLHRTTQSLNKVGKLYLVDLAGSERNDKTGAIGKT